MNTVHTRFIWGKKKKKKKVFDNFIPTTEDVVFAKNIKSTEFVVKQRQQLRHYRVSVQSNWIRGTTTIAQLFLLVVAFVSSH